MNVKVKIHAFKEKIMKDLLQEIAAERLGHEPELALSDTDNAEERGYNIGLSTAEEIIKKHI